MKASNYTLYQGDCLEVMKDIPDNSVDCIICDLPYGTTVCKWDKIISFTDMWKELKRIRKQRIAIVFFGKEPFSSLLRCSNIEEFKYDWVWKKDTKSNFPQAPYQPLNNLEYISIFSDGYARYGDNKMVYFPQMIKSIEYNIPRDCKTSSIFQENHKNGIFKHKQRDTSLRYPYNLLEFNTDKQRFHPTQKPVALLEYLVKTYSNEGDTILDFTMGSGSTGVECMNTNRKFVGIEKEEKYFKIAEDRIEEASNNLNKFMG